MAERLEGFAVLTLSSIATSVADSLYRFVEELPDHDAARECRGLMGTLFEIKTLLRELDLQFQDPRLRRLSEDLLNDIVVGVRSCSTSLRQLDGVILRCNAAKRNSAPTGARNAWDEIQSTFRNLEGSSIPKRLDMHKKFLHSVAGLLRYGRPKKTEVKVEISKLQEQLRQIAAQQEKAAARMRELEESHKRAVEEQVYVSKYTMPPSLPTPPYESSPPRRPYTPGPSPFPISMDAYRGITGHGPTPPLTPVSPISPISPLGPPPMLARRLSTPAPPGMRTATPPTPPQSTRPRMSRSAKHPQSSSTGNWWSDVFSNGPGSTTLSDIRGEGSKCHGMPMENLNMAPEEHEIFRVELDNELMLRMFRNAATEEAKVVCTVGGGGGSWNNGRRNGYRFQTFINASLLTIARVGSAIHLKRRNMPWAELYFADYETTVLFYHAFLALRHYGPNARAPDKSEHWLDDEDLKFSAPIHEGGQVHLLRLLKDKETGCIRLAAALVGGDHDVTLWTAFITKQICTADWMYSVSPNTLVVKNIRQYSFSSSFETDFWREYRLKFHISADSRDFTRAINEELRQMTGQRAGEYKGSPTSGNRNSYF